MQDNTNPNVQRYLNQMRNMPRDFVRAAQTRRFWIDILVMTVGMFIAAMSVSFFLIPSKLIVGSITGLSLVIAKLFPFLSVGTFIFAINGILLVLSFLLIGNEFGAKTVYTALILGPMVDFLDWVCPVNQSLFAQVIEGTGQVITNPWFDLMGFVLVLSFSQSILFSINASTGGLDILAKIINKYAHVNLGMSVTIGGGLICCTAFLINPVSLVLIGLLGTWINGIILNYFMSNINSQTRVYIISDEYKKLQDFIINTMHRGCTLHRVIGGYTNKERMQLELVLSPDDFSLLIDFMHKEHIASFMTSDSVSQVYGLWNKRKLLQLSEHFD